MPLFLLPLGGRKTIPLELNYLHILTEKLVDDLISIDFLFNRQLLNEVSYFRGQDRWEDLARRPGCETFLLPLLRNHIPSS